MANRRTRFAGEERKSRRSDRRADARRDPAELLRETIELSKLGERLRVAGARVRGGRV
ncbi:MAG: hypothetical protein H0X55_09700 [Thermoleophilaceae bacterium]|nr:hypothetical protein [Thermoleophilaceae bacterium]